LSAGKVQARIAAQQFQSAIGSKWPRGGAQDALVAAPFRGGAPNQRATVQTGLFAIARQTRADDGQYITVLQAHRFHQHLI